MEMGGGAAQDWVRYKIALETEWKEDVSSCKAESLLEEVLEA